MTATEMTEGIQKLTAYLDRLKAERDAAINENLTLKSTIDELQSRALDPNALQALADLIARAAA